MAQLDMFGCAPASPSLFHDLEHFRNLPAPLCIPFSGGRSSGMLLCHIAEANGGLPPGAEVVFENTSLELDETYAFLDRLERHLGIRITRLEFNPDEPGQFEVVGHNSMKRDGEVMERLLSQMLPKRRDGTEGVRPLPNPTQRMCTANLKTKTAHRYLRTALGWPTKYYTTLGYRRDESRRVKRRQRLDSKGLQEGGTGLFPLFHANITSDDVHWFWRRMPFDLGIDSNMGNCDFCFMKSEWKLKEMALLYPERAERWARWEERQASTDRPGVFRDDRPNYRQIIEQVRAGNMEGSRAGERCGTCGD